MNIIELEIQTLLSAAFLITLTCLAAFWRRHLRLANPIARGIDPVGEAEVLLFMGKNDQAIMVLKTALRDRPSDLGIKVTLLRAFAQARRERDYVRLAAEVSSELKHQPIWKQICQAGRTLAPKNHLFD